MTKHERIATRKATNLSLDVDLVADAKALGINLSRTCEDALRSEIASARRRQWKEDNAAGIAASNAYVEQHGLPLEKYRRF
ncbi:type II toxin-antitoxin system CcdA family antitoxin [Sphingomonas bisphenolicum]|uniref:Post-segregation antitoxin CcdA n=1 Tax=Sphingomonas bisphenolicum TaxID=296544 RepID=A0ABN5WJN4_9SPHN|nr:type II toxin-antitoxin system CcdA family antitoxin [Sphingomonas bisphenolicum]BBF70445.1 hypothetical protein SBA_ch1_26450 [Sphingomonas bisphenolicum]